MLKVYVLFDQACNCNTLIWNNARYVYVIFWFKNRLRFQVKWSRLSIGAEVQKFKTLMAKVAKVWIKCYLDLIEDKLKHLGLSTRNEKYNVCW